MPVGAEDDDAALDEDFCDALDPPQAASETHNPSEHTTTAARESRERFIIIRMAHHTTVQP
jgi:hypothetical protein